MVGKCYQPIVWLFPADLQVFPVQSLQRQFQALFHLLVVTLSESSLGVSVGAEESISSAVMRRQIVQHLPPDIINT